MPGKPSVSQSKPRRMALPLDLSEVVVRTKKMNAPELVFQWDGTIGESTVLGGRMLIELAQELGSSSSRPSNLEVSAVTTAGENVTEETLGDVAVVPVHEKSLSTLSVKWPKERKAQIDCAKLFAARRFVIPHRQKAYVPMSVEEIEGLGKAVVLQFTQARFAEIEGKAKAKGDPAKQEATEHA